MPPRLCMQSCASVSSASLQVAFAWAEALGPAKGQRTLQRLGLLDRAVAHGVDSGRYEGARQLAQAASAGHLAAWSHHQHALALQAQGAWT